MTPKTKMLWGISKEQEQKVLSGKDIDLEELEGLFKMIRSAEYRRGKEGGREMSIYTNLIEKTERGCKLQESLGSPICQKDCLCFGCLVELKTLQFAEKIYLEEKSKVKTCCYLKEICSCYQLGKAEAEKMHLEFVEKLKELLEKGKSKDAWGNDIIEGDFNGLMEEINRLSNSPQPQVLGMQGGEGNFINEGQGEIQSGGVTDHLPKPSPADTQTQKDEEAGK